VHEFSKDKFSNTYITWFNTDGTLMKLNKEDQPKEDNICEGIMNLKKFP
jgi:hypothetical protein